MASLERERADSFSFWPVFGTSAVEVSCLNKTKLDSTGRIQLLNMTTVLYSYWRSSCSWRVRIALKMKKIDYEYRAVHLVKDGGEQYSSSYTAKNPMAQVPTLEIDGVVLTQSMAILEYLNDTRPEPPILPKCPLKKAIVREICQCIVSGIQPLQNLAVLQKIGETKMEWGHYWIEKNFHALENLLSKSSGKYCVGDEVTMADMCLVPQVYNAERFKVDMTPFPNITRINETLSALEDFKAAHPSMQPDKQ